MYGKRSVFVILVFLAVVQCMNLRVSIKNQGVDIDNTMSNLNSTLGVNAGGAPEKLPNRIPGEKDDEDEQGKSDKKDEGNNEGSGDTATDIPNSTETTTISAEDQTEAQTGEQTVEEKTEKTEDSSEGSTEGSTEASTEESSEASTEASTEESSETSTDASTEASTEASTNASTEASTEGSTEGSTGASTEGSTEGSSEGSTEGSSEASTEDDGEETTTTEGKEGEVNAEGNNKDGEDTTTTEAADDTNKDGNEDDSKTEATTEDSDDDTPTEDNEAVDVGDNASNACRSVKYQSPINIDTKDTISTSYQKLVFDDLKRKPRVITLENDGKTVKALLSTPVPITISGGPLIMDTYELEELHFHWSTSDKNGSETQINDFAYPLEMQMLWFNIDYDKLNAAMSKENGLLILSILFELDDDDNEEYADIVDGLSSIVSTNSSTDINSTIEVGDLLKGIDINHYYTFEGSTTTPPYCPSNWIVFADSLKISEKQLKEFRKIDKPDNGRKIQSTKSRLIFENQILGQSANGHTDNSPVTN